MLMREKKMLKAKNIHYKVKCSRNKSEDLLEFHISLTKKVVPVKPMSI